MRGNTASISQGLNLLGVNIQALTQRGRERDKLGHALEPVCKMVPSSLDGFFLALLRTSVGRNFFVSRLHQVAGPNTTCKCIANASTPQHKCDRFAEKLERDHTNSFLGCCDQATPVVKLHLSFNFWLLSLLNTTSECLSNPLIKDNNTPTPRAQAADTPTINSRVQLKCIWPTAQADAEPTSASYGRVYSRQCCSTDLH